MAQNHRISDIRDLDDANKAKLLGLGIRRIEDLLERATSDQGRVALAGNLVLIAASSPSG